MATTSVSQSVTLAKPLPPRLQRFFARYPPTQILNPLPDGEYARTGYQEERRNPFLPKKFHATGKTHNPVYSLRRQADLVKLARENGVEELLPFTPKKTEEQLKHRVKYGLRVKGTGVDQKVKGKIHERQLATKYVLHTWLVCAAPAGRTWANHATPGWRRGEKPCSRCRHSSGNGKRYVFRYGTISSGRLLIYLSGRKEELDQMAQISCMVMMRLFFMMCKYVIELHSHRMMLRRHESQQNLRKCSSCTRDYRCPICDRSSPHTAKLQRIYP